MATTASRDATKVSDTQPVADEQAQPVNNNEPSGMKRNSDAKIANRDNNNQPKEHDDKDDADENGDEEVDDEEEVEEEVDEEEEEEDEANNDADNEQDLQSSQIDNHSQQPPLTTVKKFYVFRNGESVESPRVFTYNTRQLRTWEAFLENLTDSLKPRLGPIRNIKTPHGKRFIKSFDEFEAQGKYIAVPRGDRFRQLDYENVPVSKPAANRKSYATHHHTVDAPIQPVIHSRIKMNSRIFNQQEKKSIYFFVYKNGEFQDRAAGVLLKPQEQTDMNRVFAAIETRLVLSQSRPIRKLYTVDGRLIRSPNEIRDQEHYVAASQEHHCKGAYGRRLPPIHAGKMEHPYNEFRSLRQLPTPPEKVARSHEPTPRRPEEDDDEEEEDMEKEDSTSNQPQQAKFTPDQVNAGSSSTNESGSAANNQNQSSEPNTKDQEAQISTARSNQPNSQPTAEAPSATAPPPPGESNSANTAPPTNEEEKAKEKPVNSGKQRPKSAPDDQMSPANGRTGVQSGSSKTGEK